MAPQTDFWGDSQKTEAKPTGGGSFWGDIDAAEPLKTGEGMWHPIAPYPEMRSPTETVGHFRMAQRVGRPEMQREAGPVLTGTEIASAALPAVAAPAIGIAEGGGVLPVLKNLASTYARGKIGTLAGGMVGGELGGMFGPRGRAIGTGIGGLAGGYLAGRQVSPEEAFEQKVSRGVQNAAVRQAVKERLGIPNVSPRAGGAAPAAGMPSVMVAPEPTATPTGVREGSAFSVPREQLPSMIQQGSEGAGQAFRSAGGKLLFAPRGAGISNVRERVTIPEMPKGYSIGAPTTEGTQTTIPAIHEGREAGSLNLTNEGDHLRVSLMSLERPHQGKGLAPQLLNRAREAAGEQGVPRITSDWRYGTDPKAAAAWKKLGAEEQTAPNGERMFVLSAK